MTMKGWSAVYIIYDFHTGTWVLWQIFWMASGHIKYSFWYCEKNHSTSKFKQPDGGKDSCTKPSAVEKTLYVHFTFFLKTNVNKEENSDSLLQPLADELVFYCGLLHSRQWEILLCSVFLTQSEPSFHAVKMFTSLQGKQQAIMSVSAY